MSELKDIAKGLDPEARSSAEADGRTLATKAVARTACNVFMT